MNAALPLCIVALCIMECCVSAAPFSGPKHDLDRRGALGACPLGWTEFGAYCYLVSGQIKSYSDAKQWCSGQGADLVKINSAEENEFVLQLVRQKAPSLKQAWIGLEWITDRFYWSDYSVPVYFNWAANEPNRNGAEPCGHMWVSGHRDVDLPYRASGSWNDLACHVRSDLPNGLVCKKLRPS
ncbi:hypothetical protein ACROYT_G033124 [Oculina patagonica]